MERRCLRAGQDQAKPLSEPKKAKEEVHYAQQNVKTHFLENQGIRFKVPFNPVRAGGTGPRHGGWVSSDVR
jgi:hypothetical protein